MFRKLLAVAAVALCSVGAASAANGPKSIDYSFLGTLNSVPANGAVSITVTGGNKAALRAMLGAPVTQTFAYDGSTEFLQWSQGIPTIVQAGNLASGTYVWVHVRAPRGSSLAQIEQTDASLVGDHGAELYKPTQPLYLFRGTLTAVGTSSVTLNVMGGDRRALRLMIGAGSSQTFTTGDDTIFLLWQGKVPTVIDASKLVVGDRVVVRIRAAAGSSLAQVESTAAAHVGDREPAA